MKNVCIFLAATAVASPVFAGGPVAPEAEPIVVAEPAPIIAPSGDWAGFYAGAQIGYGDVGSSTGTLDGNGALGGVHAGYRWDLGTTVLGAEADYDFASIDLGAAAGSLDSVARLKLIGGADLGRTFVYATAGAAYASAAVGGAELSDTGYFLGAGLDYAITDQWSLGGEVLEHRFKDFDGSGVDLDATTVKAKVSFSF